MATQNSVNLTAGTGLSSLVNSSGYTLSSTSGSVAFSASLANSILNATGNGNLYSFTGLDDTVTGVTNTGQFNPSTGVFLCDAAGLYFFAVQITYTNIAANDQGLLVFSLSSGPQTTSIVTLTPTFGPDAGGQYFSALFSMVPGNTVTCTASVTGEVGNTLSIAGNDSTDNATMFFGYRIK